MAATVVAAADAAVVDAELRPRWPVSNIATHQSPVWREKADFVIQASLASFGMPNRWEQLWARRVSKTGFEICCIPFFTYGIALGDTVATETGQDFEYVVQRVVTKSGHKTARVAVIDPGAASRLHDEIHRKLAKSFPHEWYAPGYVAVDIAGTDQEAAITELFSEYTKRGEVSYEIDA
jgi:hypothetical protein